MNKDTLSWIHYFYATVTASVSRICNFYGYG